MIKLYNQGGIEAIYSAKWGRGGLRDKSFCLSDDQKAWATSKITLRQ